MYSSFLKYFSLYHTTQRLAFAERDGSPSDGLPELLDS
ncbi:hypothetical protein CHCC5027_4572 [Bacillus paralicheniformis]|nr:hypothetical protein CHCC5027_4572 [Bacillus paralicheniformis]